MNNFGADSRVHIIHQVNRGKSAALSLAMSQAKTKIVVTIDADTEIEPDAISKLLRHFSDPRVGAVAGNVKVGNRTRWLTRWQALEYITSQNMEKRAFDLLNCITVVPGALGAWRTEAIEAAGGITSDTVAEDADLTIAIRRLGWRISYDEEAIAWTEAPETPGALIRQRFRWTFGTLQSFWKHRDTLLRPKYGTLGWIALPNIFVFQLVLAAHFADYRFDVSRLARTMGRRPTAYRAIAAALDHRRCAAIVIFLHRIFAHRRTHLHGGLRAGTQGRLDPAHSCALTALLLSPINVRGAFPLREGSGQRPPGGLAWCRAGFSSRSACSRSARKNSSRIGFRTGKACIAVCRLFHPIIPICTACKPM